MRSLVGASLRRISVGEMSKPLHPRGSLSGQSDQQLLYGSRSGDVNASAERLARFQAAAGFSKLRLFFV